MKRCPECGEDRPLDCFFRDKTKASGRATYCKPCQTQRWLEWSRGPGHDRVLARTQRDYRRRGGWAAIADKRNESRRRRYREDPEYRRRVLDRAAERYAADPGLRERLTAKATARNRERPDRIIEATQLRRARIAEVRVGPVSRQRVMERDDWTCWICETPGPSLDHVVALSDGGEHSEDNLRCAPSRLQYPSLSPRASIAARPTRCLTGGAAMPVPHDPFRGFPRGGETQPKKKSKKTAKRAVSAKTVAKKAAAKKTTTRQRNPVAT